VNNKLDLKIFLALLINENDKELRLNAGKALTTLAYNNTLKQFEIKTLGGISYSIYENIIESDDEMQICKACFQVKYSLPLCKSKTILYFRLSY